MGDWYTRTEVQLHGQVLAEPGMPSKISTGVTAQESSIINVETDGTCTQT